MQVQQTAQDHVTLPNDAEGEVGITNWLNLLRVELKSRGAAVSRPRQNCQPDDFVTYLMDVSAAGRDFQLQCSIVGKPRLTMRLVFTEQATNSRVLGYNSYLGDNAEAITLSQLAEKFAGLTYKVVHIADHFQRLCEQQELVH